MSLMRVSGTLEVKASVKLGSLQRAYAHMFTNIASCPHWCYVLLMALNSSAATAAAQNTLFDNSLATLVVIIMLGLWPQPGSYEISQTMDKSSIPGLLLRHR